MKKKLQQNVKEEEMKQVQCEGFIFNNSDLKHKKPLDALNDLMCKPVSCRGFETHEWKCVLGRCDACPSWDSVMTSPNGEEEVTHQSQSHLMQHEHHEKVFRCSLHQRIDSKVCSECNKAGTKRKVMEKKERTKAVMPTGKFKLDPCRNVMEKCKCHCPHMKILS